jgi:hypothetical protein
MMNEMRSEKERLMSYLHELTFETKEQAEKAAGHLSNVEQVNITDVSEDGAYFVDVLSAFSLQFRTTYALDMVEQGVLLLNSRGLILEMPPAFNLDAEQEWEMAEVLDV